MPPSNASPASGAPFPCSLLVSYTNTAEKPSAKYVRKAGGLAGTVVDISLYPIDTLKTRLQSSRGFAASGGFRGIYGGVGSAIVGSAPGAALFFVTYESSKKLFRNYDNSGDCGKDMNSMVPHFEEAVEHMAAASLGEIVACAVRVPTEVVKQRAQASQHPSSLAALQDILVRRSSGGMIAVWRGLYRGWGITIIREVPFTIIQFPLWEALKKWRLEVTGRDSNSATESAIFGAISGAIAAGVTTPLDVLKTRMILAKEKQQIIPLTRRILSESGPRAFFAGLGPRIVWISAGGAIFLGSYQWAFNSLSTVF